MFLQAWKSAVVICWDKMPEINNWRWGVTYFILSANFQSRVVPATGKHFPGPVKAGLEAGRSTGQRLCPSQLRASIEDPAHVYDKCNLSNPLNDCSVSRFNPLMRSEHFWFNHLLKHPSLNTDVLQTKPWMQEILENSQDPYQPFCLSLSWI